jgi:hypothetical protein
MAKFRHKTIRRFKVSEFEFDNFELILQDEDEAEKFRDLVKQLPKRDSMHIVEINDAAAAAAEKSVVGESSTVVRGAQSAESLLTEEDRKRLALQQGAGSTQPGASNPTAAGNALAPSSAIAALNAAAKK